MEDLKNEKVICTVKCNFLFSFKFSKDGSTEDLSDVSATGYRKYQDTKLKWSAKILPDWREYKDENIHNEVQFDGLQGELFFSKYLFT